MIPRNVAYFVEGRCDDKIKSVYASELSEMLRVKDCLLRLKRIKNQDDKHAYTMNAKALPTFLFNHDGCVRDVIGKFLHDRGRQSVSFERPADASIMHYHFELDNGCMDDKQLEEKFLKHYANSDGQIVFIMRHRECPELEAERLQKIFRISEKVFYNKPNKVLGACYSQFLENGILYNRKGRIYATVDPKNIV